MRVLLPLKKTNNSSSESDDDDQQYASDSSFENEEAQEEEEEEHEPLDNDSNDDEASEQGQQNSHDQSQEDLIDASVAVRAQAVESFPENVVPVEHEPSEASSSVTTATASTPTANKASATIETVPVLPLAPAESSLEEAAQVKKADTPPLKSTETLPQEVDCNNNHPQQQTAYAESKPVAVNTPSTEPSHKKPAASHALNNKSSISHCKKHSLSATAAISAAVPPQAAAVAPPTPVPEVAIVASSYTTCRPRKRRSPESQSLDSKPASRPTPTSSSKKSRVRPVTTTDDPADLAIKKPAALKKDSSSIVTAASTNNHSNMTGGRRKVNDHRRWPSSNSYYIDNNNNNNNNNHSSSSNNTNAPATNTGRDDVPLNEDVSAEMDVRYAYPRENNPASARGDTFHNKNNFAGRDDQEEVAREEAVARNKTVAEEGFAAALKKQGLEIVEQEGDGNCLFRAISLQVYGDATMHGEVRQRCLDFMERDQEHFSQFITDEPFVQYIRRKRQDGVHGNNPEIQAISELFNRPIEVFVPENGATPLNIFHAEYKTADAPIRLSYHDGNHYNAVVDPFLPTAGLGLGLPGLQPGLADKMQMAKAVAESDKLADQGEYERALKESQDDQLQRAIKESSLSVDSMYKNKAISLSDCDATNFELEQAVLESSLESFRNYEHGRKQASSDSGSTREGRGRANAEKAAPRAFAKARDAAPLNSGVASIPVESREDTRSRSPVTRTASVASASVASAAASVAAIRPDHNEDNGGTDMMGTAEQYPQSVQELCMNGFELRKVVRAYELVGDNFDDLLGFLMSTSGT